MSALLSSLGRHGVSGLKPQRLPVDLRRDALAGDGPPPFQGLAIDRRRVLRRHAPAHLPHAHLALADGQLLRADGRCEGADALANLDCFLQCCQGAGFGVAHGRFAQLIDHVRDCEPNTNVMQEPIQITAVNKSYDLSTLGGRLTWARERLNLSQQDLAARAGVSQGTIGNIESGLRKKPRELLAIASAVEVSPEWLQSRVGAAELPPSAAWPFSSELLQALAGADAETIRRAENGARSHLDLPPLPKTNERNASATDVRTTFEGSAVSTEGDLQSSETPLGGSSFDIDQGLANSLHELARQLQTMASTQRQAIVAKLRNLGDGSSWGETRGKELGEQMIDHDAPQRSRARKASK